jgi:hypothetical protein
MGQDRWIGFCRFGRQGAIDVLQCSFCSFWQILWWFLIYLWTAEMAGAGCAPLPGNGLNRLCSLLLYVHHG